MENGRLPAHTFAALSAVAPDNAMKKLVLQKDQTFGSN